MEIYESKIDYMWQKLVAFTLCFFQSLRLLLEQPITGQTSHLMSVKTELNVV